MIDPTCTNCGYEWDAEQLNKQGLCPTCADAITIGIEQERKKVEMMLDRKLCASFKINPILCEHLACEIIYNLLTEYQMVNIDLKK